MDDALQLSRYVSFKRLSKNRSVENCNILTFHFQFNSSF